MTITQIDEISKTKRKIWIDGEFAFILYRGELSYYHIEEGAFISEEIICEIFDNVLFKRAKLYSMNLLKTRDYTQKELERKLSILGYPNEIVNRTISYVKEYRYIDDCRYVRNYISTQSQKKSKMRILADLSAKGIDREEIEHIYEELLQTGECPKEEEQIRYYIKKRKYDPFCADYNDKKKMTTYLLQKGFSMEKIRRVFSEWEE